MTAPTPPAGVEARTSSVAGCVGEWIVPGSEPHRGVRILFFDNGVGRRIEIGGPVANVRAAGHEAPDIRGWAWALCRAADWVAVDPRPVYGPPEPEPEMTIYDFLEGASA